MFRFLCAAFIAPALILVPAALAQDSALQAGAARVSIVPPFPTQMGGYFDRDETFTGVDRPIHARALVLSDGNTSVAVVGTDLIAVSRELVELSRNRIEAETGIPAGNVLISATHNHSGPSGFAGATSFGQPLNEELTDFLVDQIAAAVAEAHAALQPADLGFAMGHLDSITHNRQQDNDTVIDPDVGVLKVTAAGSREVIGTLLNFTGHPVILGGGNLLLSCEFPGVAAGTVEDVLGGVAVFTQGACGDVTMKRSGDPFEEITRLGRVVAGEVLKTAEQIRPGDDTTLQSFFENVDVAPRDVPTPELAEANLEALRTKVADAKQANANDRRIRQLEREAGAAETTLSVARFVAEKPEALDRATKASVHVMQLGPLVVVGIPGELFVEYGLEMKARVEQATGRPMILAGYANDYIGYIVTPRAQHTGGYEHAISRVAPTAGRTLTEAAMDLVNEHIEPAGE